MLAVIATPHGSDTLAKQLAIRLLVAITTYKDTNFSELISFGFRYFSTKSLFLYI
jgi:hypothetical protein